MQLAGRRYRQATSFSLRFLLLVLFGCLSAASSWTQQLQTITTVDHGPNATRQLSKHYVILVSFDGFRYDYAKRYGAKNLLALASRGASAPLGMIPSYPSVTFPNHYTIVTGLYPEHHGIVGNVFYDPARKQVYSYKDEAALTEGSWYGGTPLWVLAEQQGMRAGCFFWPGSEADIQGVRPSYYAKFDDHFPNEKRVEQVLAWLRLPPAQRPHFITLYFSDTDGAGDKHGPDSPEVAAAVHELDAELGSLSRGVAALKLPVDLIVVADHGMTTIRGPWINLDQHGLDRSLLEKYEGELLYARSDADAQQIVESLRPDAGEFRVYRRAQLPEHLHFDANPRAGDPVIVQTGPFAIRVTAGSADEAPNPGSHGFDPMILREMNATFVASGPDIRPGVSVPPFENVNLYPLIAKILGLDISALKTGSVDGRLAVLQNILTKPN